MQDFTGMKPVTHTETFKGLVYVTSVENLTGHELRSCRHHLKRAQSSPPTRHLFFSTGGVAKKSFNVLSYKHKRLLPNKSCMLSYFSLLVLEGGSNIVGGITELSI